MPYVITSRTPSHDPLCDACPHTSRQAVATLEEARNTCIEATPEPIGLPGIVVRLAEQIATLPGAVGPLPDGTVIEVARVDWRTLCDRTGLPYPGSDADRAAILAAESARRSS